MSGSSELCLCPTVESDLDFVISLEGHPDSKGFVKQWSYDEHLDAIERTNREHWIIKSSPNGESLGYLIAYDLRSEGCGV